LFRLNGLQAPEVKEEDEFKPLTCPKCKTRNSPDAKFCSNCGMYLDEKTAVEMDRLREKADKLMSELVKNPRVLDLLMKVVERIKEET